MYGKEEKGMGEIDLNFAPTHTLSKEEKRWRDTERLLVDDVRYIERDRVGVEIEDSFPDEFAEVFVGPIDIMRWKGTEESFVLLKSFLKQNLLIENRRTLFITHNGDKLPLPIGDYVLRFRNSWKVVNMYEMHEIMGLKLRSKNE
jgi:hypothetical protein